jgi:putative transposase
MAQTIRFPGDVKSVVVSQDGDRWFASFLVQLDDTWVYPNTCENQEVLGIDLGVSALAVTSDGEYVENPRWLVRHGRKLRRLQKGVSRKQKGSNNRRKAVHRLHTQYRRVRNARNDFLHKLTSGWIGLYGFIGVEDLNVSGMMSNHRLAKSVSDVSFYEIRRQLTYKTQLAGSTLVLADRFYPSSKKCSSCENIKDNLLLSERTYVCNACGFTVDRDLNAAHNLKLVARRYRETLNACGTEGSGPRLRTWVKPSVKKQEPGNLLTKMVTV